MTDPFWPVFAGVFAGMIGAAAAFYSWLLQKIRLNWLNLWRSKFPPQISHLGKKLTWQNYLESNLRAVNGTVLERPFGSARHDFAWRNIQFNPAYLSRLPFNADHEIDTALVLAPKAKKPLTLQIPILIGAMSYGNALSLPAKVSLAKAATLAGTATCSGNGPFLPEERQAARHYVFQYSRGFWSKNEAVFRQADLIEIGFGHGAWVSAPVRIKGQKINSAFGKRLCTIPGLDVLIEAHFPEVEDLAAWRKLVATLKEVSGGTPVGVKFGLTHEVEKELALMIAADIDVIIFDGLEGGTHGCPPLLLDDIGLPTFPGLCRVVRYLESQGRRDQVSLVVGGGLATPGDFAKSLALGADAALIGTIAALTMSHTQITQSTPWEPPTGLLFFEGKEQQQFDPDLGARNLAYFLEGCILEMQNLTRSLGKSSLQELNKEDLVALDPLYAKIAGIELLY